MVEIRDVRTRRDLACFVAFPERLYGRHPHDVPKLEGEEIATLSAARNPAFAHCEARGRRVLLPYVPEVFGLINETYAGLYGVVAVSDAQVAFYTKAFFGFINHEFVTIILDAGNRVAAFGIAMPSLSTALQKCRGRLFPFGFVRLLRALRRNDRLDLLLVAYACFYAIPILVGGEIYARRPDGDFRRWSVVCALAFFVSYGGYLLLPAIGPRFTLHDVTALDAELPGLWLTAPIRAAINLGGLVPAGVPNAAAAAAAARDAFPSGHTMLALVAMWWGRTPAARGVPGHRRARDRPPRGRHHRPGSPACATGRPDADGV